MSRNTLSGFQFQGIAAGTALLLVGLVSTATLAAPKPKVKLCHRTKGANPFVLVSVSGNAVAGHFAHGDRAADTCYLDEDGDHHGQPDTIMVACACPDGWAEQGDDCDDTQASIAPSAQEICGNGIDENCDGVVDEGCNACVPVFGFSDGFNGDGLDPAWSTDPSFPAPVLDGGAACGDVQAVAFRSCIGDASAWRVTFTFSARSNPSREAYAVFSDGDPFTPGATTYSLGCDGGIDDEGSDGVTCGLTIVGGSTPQVFAGPTTAGIEAGVEYFLVADVGADGSLAVEVFVEVFDDWVSKLRLTATAPNPIIVRSAGFVVGREDAALTCLDDFTLTTMP